MYNPEETISTNIQISQCSMYLRANIQVAVILSAVVNESIKGTFESVNFKSTNRINAFMINVIMAIFNHKYLLVVFTGIFEEFDGFLPFNQ